MKLGKILKWLIISFILLFLIGSFIPVLQPVVIFLSTIDLFAIPFISVACVVELIISRTTTKTIEIKSQKIINQQNSNINNKCPSCGAELKATDKFCEKCGVNVSQNNSNIAPVQPKVRVYKDNFDPIFSLSEGDMLNEFIKRKLADANYNESSNLTSLEFLKKKRVFGIILAALVFVFISLIFFHFPIYTYLIGIICLIIFIIKSRKYNFNKFLVKQIKSRPQEKISNIIMSNSKDLVKDDSKLFIIICLTIAIMSSLLLFMKPRILYEKTDGGYAVRYYIFGLTNNKTATIPEKYKGEKVVSLRGNTFSNMRKLESVILPDTITEIRGQAFRNCKKLVSVNIPKNLNYLGGGAFYNAKSIKEIYLPDTLTFLGGESFYGASSLEKIHLSSNLTEIRGDSFEYCDSLKYIEIPDKIERIGGHAFYGDSLLSEVKISPNSKLTEIGSSAFRMCSSLKTITIPRDVYVNDRAFKESPTIIKRYKEGIDYEYQLSLFESFRKKAKEIDNNDYVFDDLSEIVYFNNYNMIVEKKEDDTYYYINVLTEDYNEDFIINKTRIYKTLKYDNYDIYIFADNDDFRISITKILNSYNGG